MTELVFVPIVGMMVLIGGAALLLWRAIPAQKRQRQSQRDLPFLNTPTRTSWTPKPQSEADRLIASRR